MNRSLVEKLHVVQWLVLATWLVVLYTVDRYIKLGFLNAPNHFGGVLWWLPFDTGLYYNPGIVLSLSLPLKVTIIASIALLVFVAYYLVTSWQAAQVHIVTAWGMIFIGGMSNLWDRMLFSAVIDWLILPWGAVANFADLYISIGIAVLLVEVFILAKRTKLQDLSELNSAPTPEE